ncbi:MAG: DnaD domain protein [Thermoanaerobacteraceae bacterium]|nr:DnaD domain protein [Thermoanaerobacteraceae bacterium]
MEALSPFGLLMEQGVTVVPNILLKNYVRLGLDEQELVILLQLLLFRQSEKERRPFVKTLSQLTTIPEVQIQELLAQLENKGFIRLASIQDEKGRWSKVYLLDGLYNRLQELFNNNTLHKGREQDFDRLAKLFSQVTGLPLAPKHERMIIQWLYEYDFPLQLLEYVLIECHERGGIWQKDWRIKSIVDNLYAAGLKSVEEVKEWFLSYDEDYYWVNKFAAVLGRAIRSEPEKRALKRWSQEWGFSDEMIIKAMEKSCLATSQPSFNYIESILKSWKEKGITTPEQANKEDAVHRERRVKKKEEKKVSHRRNIPKIDPETGMVIT